MRRRNRKRWKKSASARTKKEKCATKWCRNVRAEKKVTYRRTNGTLIVYTTHLRHCWKCKARQLKERHPWTYVLNMLRHSARKRGLPLTLTVESFKQWCKQTGYLERRGNKPEDLTIDRIDRNEGYHIWNIRALTHRENSMQGADNTPRDERTGPEPDYVQPTDPNEPF